MQTKADKGRDKKSEPKKKKKILKTIKKNSEPKCSLILKTSDNNQAGRINLLGDTK